MLLKGTTYIIDEKSLLYKAISNNDIDFLNILIINGEIGKSDEVVIWINFLNVNIHKGNSKQVKTAFERILKLSMYIRPEDQFSLEKVLAEGINWANKFNNLEIKWLFLSNLAEFNINRTNLLEKNNTFQSIQSNHCWRDAAENGTSLPSSRKEIL